MKSIRAQTAVLHVHSPPTLKKVHFHIKTVASEDFQTRKAKTGNTARTFVHFARFICRFTNSCVVALSPCTFSFFSFLLNKQIRFEWCIMHNWRLSQTSRAFCLRVKLFASSVCYKSLIVICFVNRDSRNCVRLDVEFDQSGSPGFWAGSYAFIHTFPTFTARWTATTKVRDAHWILKLHSQSESAMQPPFIQIVVWMPAWWRYDAELRERERT